LSTFPTRPHLSAARVIAARSAHRCKHPRDSKDVKLAEEERPGTKRGCRPYRGTGCGRHTNRAFSVAVGFRESAWAIGCRTTVTASRGESLRGYPRRDGVDKAVRGRAVKEIHELPNCLGSADTREQVFGPVEYLAGSDRIWTAEIISGLPWDTPLTWGVIGLGRWVCPCHSSEWNRHGCCCCRGDEQFLEHVCSPFL
jgi:hypothetical protein